MRTDTEHPLPLSPAQAVAFHQAVEDRDEYIAEQPYTDRHSVAFEESVPRPGCPYCWGDAREVQWHVLAHETWTVVGPCGHWFTTERPVEVRRSGDGWITVEEWMP